VECCRGHSRHGEAAKMASALICGNLTMNAGRCAVQVVRCAGNLSSSSVDALQTTQSFGVELSPELLVCTMAVTSKEEMLRDRASPKETRYFEAFFFLNLEISPRTVGLGNWI